eukprot:7378838-Prymnesium_polylepis.1
MVFKTDPFSKPQGPLCNGGGVTPDAFRSEDRSSPASAPSGLWPSGLVAPARASSAPRRAIGRETPDRRTTSRLASP